MQRILVVDDEVAIVDVLEAYLRNEGYDVHTAFDGEAALAVAARELPDLVLLDLTMPKLSGIEVFRELRRRSNVPVIMITSRVEEVDRVVGLELGADDYIGKPFSPREVVARVRAVLRRSSRNVEPPANVLRSGEIVLDHDARSVRRGSTELHLTPTEFSLLEILMSQPGRTFTRAQLLDRIADDGTIYDRTLDRHIANLRGKIEVESTRPKTIVTVFGVGYKFVGE